MSILHPKKKQEVGKVLQYPNVLQYPDNTKAAIYIAGPFTILVMCPHCHLTHHHGRDEINKMYLRAPCNLGYYVLAK
jgi:heterodisulfide reductase subunit B